MSLSYHCTCTRTLGAHSKTLPLARHRAHTEDCTRVLTVIPHYAVHGLLHAHLSTLIHPRSFSATRACTRWLDLISITFTHRGRTVSSRYRNPTSGLMTTWQPIAIAPCCYQRSRNPTGSCETSTENRFFFHPRLLFYTTQHVQRSLADAATLYLIIHQRCARHPLRLSRSCRNGGGLSDLENFQERDTLAATLFLLGRIR